MTTTTERPRTRSEINTQTAAAKNAALLEDLEHLIACHVGEAAILHTTGYTRNPAALKRRLMRLGRHDLTPRIFEWDAQVDERQHPDRKPRT